MKEKSNPLILKMMQSYNETAEEKLRMEAHKSAPN